MKKIIITAFLAVIGAANTNATTILGNNNEIIPSITIKTVFADEVINVIFQRNSYAKGSTTYILTIEDPSGTKKTETITMTDGSKRKTLALMVGSKVYVKNAAKLNMLEGGKNSSDELLMTVMMRDKNQVINLDEEKNASQAVLEANAQKSADKLKVSADLEKETVVNGNTATITYKSKSGSPMASFDMDKKTGTVKNIVDMSKNNAGKPEEKAKKEGEKKLKGLFGK